ncbi:BrnT family toxin [Bdellovibrionota bacterium FG-2]
MGQVTFEWDEKKNSANRDKHGISFEEAATIFLNVPFRVMFDPDHSDSEDRYLAIGISLKSRILLVVHCENESGTRVRIISARKATKNEQAYLHGLRTGERS